MRSISPPYSPLASPIPGATAVAAAQVATRTVKRTLVPLMCLAIFGLVTWHNFSPNSIEEAHNDSQSSDNINPDEDETLIILVTPTYARPTRLPELTRMAQTLMLVKNIHWIVIEDANRISEPVQRLLERSKIPHTYLFTTTIGDLPHRGWTHRNMALDIIRTKYKNYKGNAVVYFADDDNTYDIRLFNDYIRNVKKIGVWAVAFSGSAKVESPHVEGGRVTKWDVVYAPNRKFATDMAGFAINLKLILTKEKIKFVKKCGPGDPETCFLQQFGVKKRDLEAFGMDQEPKDILVWHTQSRTPTGKGPTYGYVYEEKKL